MSLVTLIIELLLALARVIGQQFSSTQESGNEQSRVIDASNAGLEPAGLPDGSDPLDRDGQR